MSEPNEKAPEQDVRPEPAAKKSRGGPAPSEQARRERGDLRTTLRLPAGQDADAMRGLIETHGGWVSAIRWLLRAAGVVKTEP